MKTLVSIPGGNITLRDARRGTERVVALQPFKIGETPVSAAQFVAGRLNVGVTDEGNLPALGVRWLDAVQWCNSASRYNGLEQAYRIADGDVRWIPAANGYRLPTEAEWVQTSRGGVPAARYGNLKQIAWTDLDDLQAPQCMGLKAPNAYGVYDTLGNVWEWCWDRLDPARYGDYRLFKGGGWADSEWSVRVGARRGDAPDAKLEDVGFRVACGTVSGRGNADGGQGWSEKVDRERASLQGPRPLGWTPLRTESSTGDPDNGPREQTADFAPENGRHEQER